MERNTGLEPAQTAWKAVMLPITSVSQVFLPKPGRAEGKTRSAVVIYGEKEVEEGCHAPDKLGYTYPINILYGY